MFSKEVFEKTIREIQNYLEQQPQIQFINHGHERSSDTFERSLRELLHKFRLYVNIYKISFENCSIYNAFIPHYRIERRNDNKLYITISHIFTKDTTMSKKLNTMLNYHTKEIKHRIFYSWKIYNEFLETYKRNKVMCSRSNNIRYNVIYVYDFQHHNELRSIRNAQNINRPHEELSDQSYKKHIGILTTMPFTPEYLIAYFEDIENHSDFPKPLREILMILYKSNYIKNRANYTDCIIYCAN